MTGVGGDEVMAPSTWVRVNRVLSRQVRPRPKDALRIAMAYGPRTLRVRWFQRDSEELVMPWLRPAAQRELVDRYVTTLAGEPIGHDAWVLRSWWRNRSRVIGNQSLARLAADVEAHAVHPLEDPRFLARLAGTRRRGGFATRTEAMCHLFGDVLPAPVLSRSTKAYFDDVFLGTNCRAFAEAWDGTGATTSVVDPIALKAMWRGEHGPVDGRSALLLQALWLESQSRAA